MKPIGRAQGKGIFLFHKLSQVAQWKSDYRWKPDTPGVEAYVVQKYIANPYLVRKSRCIGRWMLRWQSLADWGEEV
jgi:hypothetical protein